MRGFSRAVRPYRRAMQGWFRMYHRAVLSGLFAIVSSLPIQAEPGIAVAGSFRQLDNAISAQQALQPNFDVQLEVAETEVNKHDRLVGADQRHEYRREKIYEKDIRKIKKVFGTAGEQLSAKFADETGWWSAIAFRMGFEKYVITQFSQTRQ